MIYKIFHPNKKNNSFAYLDEEAKKMHIVKYVAEFDQMLKSEFDMNFVHKIVDWENKNFATSSPRNIFYPFLRQYTEDKEKLSKVSQQTMYVDLAKYTSYNYLSFKGLI